VVDHSGRRVECHRPAQIVVAFVQHHKVVLQIGVVLHREHEGVGAFVVVGKIDDAESPGTSGELLLEPLRHRLIPPDAKAKRRAAAEDGDAILARLFASGDWAAVPPDVEQDASLELVVQVDIGGEECRRGDEQAQRDRAGDKEEAFPGWAHVRCRMFRANGILPGYAR
jgi:hypothetical protein